MIRRWSIIVMWLTCATLLRAGEGPNAAKGTVDQLGDPLPADTAARLGTTRLRHAGPITATAWAPNGIGMASAGADDVIRLWDAANGREVGQLKGAASVTALLFTSDGKTLISADEKGVIRLWDIDRAREVRRFSAGEDRISRLALSPDNRTLYSAGIDRIVRQWLVAGGIELRAYPKHAGHLLALAVSADGKELRTASAPDVNAKINPPGDTFGLAQVFDANKGVETRRFLIKTTPDPTRLLRLATFSRDGRLVASAGGDGGLNLYEADTGNLIRSVGASAGRVSSGPRYRAAEFSPCGRFIAARDHSAVRVFGVATGQELRTFNYPNGGSVGIVSGPDGLLTPKYSQGVAYAPDGQTLLAATGHALRLWNLGDERETLPLPGPRFPFDSLCFSRDGTLVFAVGKDPAIHVWDRATGKEIASAPIGGSHVLAGTDPRNALVHATGNGIEWSLIGGKLISKAKSWDSVGIYGNVMTASSDGKVALVTLGADRGITILDGPSGKVVSRLRHAKDAAGVKAVPNVTSLAFSPDNKLLAAACSPAPIQVWSLATGRLIREFAKGGTPSFSKLAFSPDSKLLALGGPDIKIYEIASGQERRSIGPSAGLQALVFSPDGRYLAVGLAKEGVQFFDIANGIRVGQRGEAMSDVRALAIHPESGTLAAAGADTAVLLWTKLPWHEPRPAARLRLEPNELDLLWQTLAHANASRAHHAIWALVAAPEQGVPFLASKLKPEDEGKSKPAAESIRDLDSAVFEIRQKAMRELELLGDDAEQPLSVALAGELPLESRRRIEEVLARIKEAPPLEKLQTLRALEVLEHAGTVEAHRVLAALAKGRAGHWQTESARQALERRRRGPASP